MILCDTNILIEFYKGNQQILEALRLIGPASMAVSVVTVGELYYGARDRRELSKIQIHLSQIQQVPLDEDISTRFVNLLGKYALNHKLSVPDALIASTAISRDMAIYTLNTKDFHYITGLELYEP
ncbi:MAG: type II toxin-antitoxin system VapC family toxin [Thermoplasmata archaeon]|nr:type II toxin-antitoxin system VapC family toxin [Thermoplasmata archaeon]